MQADLMKHPILPEHISRYIEKCGKDDPKLLGMGTTLVGILINYHVIVIWVNCGDSRVLESETNTLDTVVYRPFAPVISPVIMRTGDRQLYWGQL